MIIVDASVLTTALCDDHESGRRARARLRGEVLAAPELIDLEVASVLRRLNANRALTDERAHQALEDLRALPMTRVSHLHLAQRGWELRANMTIYDASYIACAELFEATLVTADARLARAPGIRCAIELAM